MSFVKYCSFHPSRRWTLYPDLQICTGQPLNLESQFRRYIMNDCVLVSALTILLFFVKIDSIFFHLFSFAQFLLLLGKLSRFPYCVFQYVCESLPPSFFSEIRIFSSSSRKLFGPCYDIDASFSAIDKRFVVNYVFFPEFCKAIFYYMFGFLYHCGMIMRSIWHCTFGWSVFELLVSCGIVGRAD